MKIVKKGFLYSVIIAIFLFTRVKVHAESIGGEVSTTSGITFFEEANASIVDTVKKSIISRLPQTGEDLHGYVWIGVALVVLSLFAFYLIKRRQTRE